jgi:hypothetical protein
MLSYCSEGAFCILGPGTRGSLFCQGIRGESMGKNMKFFIFSNNVMLYTVRRVLTSRLIICMWLVCVMSISGVIGCFRVDFWGSKFQNFLIWSYDISIDASQRVLSEYV